jgi:hypothetical protein
MTAMTAETAGTELDRYVPTGTLALVPDLTPVERAPRPRRHRRCEGPLVTRDRKGRAQFVVDPDGHTVFCHAPLGLDGETPRARRGLRYCSDECQRRGQRLTRRTETADYAAMATRVIAKLGDRVGTDFDQLGELAQVAKAADAALRTAVTAIRATRDDVSWAEIGAMLGITRQGAQQRFGK